MIEKHDCADGNTVEVAGEPVEYVKGFDWEMILYHPDGGKLATVRTITPPNFCAWCSLSLKEG